jgi:uncharacterized membrane protein HdeD (DUF308 family)
VELLLGVFWVVVAIVVLRFNHASVVTVGVLTGIMFLLFAAEEFFLAVLDKGASRWVWVLFGVLLAASGIVALIHPEATFAGFADILGFVFLMIGILWTVQAFAERVFNDLWWLGLISGILMVGLAFWVSGQFFLTRAATLLVFAGIWAMVKGITDIVRGVPAPSARLELTDGERPRGPNQDRQRMSRLGQARPRRASTGIVQDDGLFGCSFYRRRWLVRRA